MTGEAERADSRRNAPNDWNLAYLRSNAFCLARADLGRAMTVVAANGNHAEWQEAMNLYRNAVDAIQEIAAAIKEREGTDNAG